MTAERVSTEDSTRRRSRGLSVDRIVSRTLDIIDDKGIAAASMRAVAASLGVEAMSLYKWVGSRDQLFDAVVDRVVNELADDPEVQTEPENGWREYLAAMARGVRRYALGHPHAFPLVATRPASAPWVNPPLRSLRWIEAFLHSLQSDGMNDDQVLFAYRTFNSFLLGYLLLETSAMAVQDPAPGDGSFDPAPDTGDSDPVDSTRPVPGGLTPTRTTDERHAVANTDSGKDLVNPVGEVDEAEYPTVHRLAEGLAVDRWDAEFEAALAGMLDRVELFLQQTG